MPSAVVTAGCLQAPSTCQPCLKEKGRGNLTCKWLRCGISLEDINTESHQTVPNSSQQRTMESYYILVLIAGILVAFVLLVLIDHYFFKGEIPPDIDQPAKLRFYHRVYTLVDILVSWSCSGILGFPGKERLEYEDMDLNTTTTCNGNTQWHRFEGQRLIWFLLPYIKQPGWGEFFQYWDFHSYAAVVYFYNEITGHVDDRRAVAIIYMNNNNPNFYV